jgi:hypothetical protein
LQGMPGRIYAWIKRIADHHVTILGYDEPVGMLIMLPFVSLVD